MCRTFGDHGEAGAEAQARRPGQRSAREDSSRLEPSCKFSLSGCPGAARRSAYTSMLLPQLREDLWPSERSLPHTQARVPALSQTQALPASAAGHPAPGPSWWPMCPSP